MDAAMNSAVSALQAQQAALSTVSDNLANSQTSGYKAVTTQFNSLLTQEAAGLGYPAGGVSATARQNVLAQGLVQGTTTTTDMAITGNGMFTVSEGLGGQSFFTRNGAFDTDASGNLVLSGTNYYLSGWETDAKGNILGANPDNIASLQNVNINKFNNSATATTDYSLVANLPAEAQSTVDNLAYTTNATPPTAQNISIGYSTLNTNVVVNGVLTTTYQVSVTTSDPNAGGIAGSDGSTSAAGQPLIYQVSVDNSGTIQQIVSPSGTTTGPTTLPTFAPVSDWGASSVGGITGTTATDSSGNPLVLSWSDLGSPFSQHSSISIFDSLGVQQTFPVTWAAAGNNQWVMTVTTPTTPDGSTKTGQLYDSLGNPVDSYSYDVSFNSDGTLNSIVGQQTYNVDNTTTPPTVTANTGAVAPTNGNVPILSASWYDGAASSLAGTPEAINVNLGTAGIIGVGQTNGLSQFDTGQTTPSMEVKSSSQNGVQYGQLTGVSVDSATGNVIAAYNNGQKVPIYKIPIVTFPNENGLSAENDGVYQQSALSGAYTLNPAGTNGAGTITGEALEQSNVNTSTEFSNMITAQQAYSSASQVIGTDKQMFTSLIQVIQ